MKEILIIVVLLWNAVMYGQILDKKNRWNDLEIKMAVCGNLKCSGASYFTHSYSLQTEKLINGTSYFELMDSVMYKSQNNEIVVLSSDIIGYLRKDSLRIYFLDKETNNEFLVYDFGLKKGDEFVIKSEVFTVDFTDSIDYNQVKRYTISLSSEARTFTWIEHIGAKEGFAYFNYDYLVDPEKQNMLLCFSYQNILLYKNENDYDCVYKNVQDNLEVKELVPYKVYPNPTNGNLIVEGNTINYIEIQDISGKVLRRQNVFESKCNLNISDLQNGIYFLKLNGATVKIIIKK